MLRCKTKAEEIRNPEHYFNRYIARERKKEQEDTEYYNLHESLDSMILYAAGKLKRNTSETSAVSSKTSKIQPPTKTQQANTQSVSFSLEAQQLYQQLADQYTRIVNNGCFGSLAQIEEKMDRCKCFLEQWMEALCNKDFVALLKSKAKYNQYVDCFGKAYIDGIGDYLLFALAYRWISKIVCCANPHGRKIIIFGSDMV